MNTRMNHWTLKSSTVIKVMPLLLVTALFSLGGSMQAAKPDRPSGAAQSAPTGDVERPASQITDQPVNFATAEAPDMPAPEQEKGAGLQELAAPAPSSPNAITV